jgi:hypothetical protein
MTSVQFNFKFANSTKSYEIHKTRIGRRFAFTLWRSTRGNSRAARRLYGERFPEGVLPSRSTFVEVHLCLCETFWLIPMVSPILRFHPFGFLFLGPHERFGIRS